MYEAANDAVYGDNTEAQLASLARPTTQQVLEGYGASTHRVSGPEPTGVARTRGHCSGNGGLRGHSVGGVFPCVVYAQGVPGTPSYQFCFKAPNGETHQGFPDYTAAYLAAGIWLDNRPVSFEPQVKV